MNLRKSFSSLLGAALLLLFAACKEVASTPKDALAYVPSTSTSVTAIDLEKLIQKADFEAVKQMEFYKNMVLRAEGDYPQMAKVLLDPQASGVDLNAKIYAATALDEQDPGQMTTYFYISLKDADAFERLVRAGKSEVVEREGINLVDEGGKTILAWNKSLAIFAFSNEQSEAFVQRVVNAFQINKENTLSKDPHLQSALNANHDITSFLSTNALARNSGAGFLLGMIDVEPTALKDNFISSYADFENGKMVGHADFDINKKMGEDFLGRFFKKEVEADFSKLLPKEQLTFATVLALDLVGIDKFLSERPNTMKYADFVLNDYGIKRSDLLAALRGDVLVAGFGSRSLKDAKILVSLSLKDEAKARELLQIAVKARKLKEIEKDLYSAISFGNADFNITSNKGFGKILLKNGMLTFCSDDGLLNQIKAGETGGESAKSLKAFDDQTLAGWFDFRALSGLLGKPGLVGGFQEMDFKVNGEGADFLLKTSDPNTNSLKAFFEMLNESYKTSGVMPQEAL